MTKRIKEFEPGHGFTKADWDEVSDSPELTAEEMAQAKPFADAFPELAASMKRAGRPKLDAPKRQVTLRLDADVVDKLKAGGPGWQTRINDVLRKAVGG